MNQESEQEVDETVIPKISIWKKLRYMIVAYSWIWLGRLLFALFGLIKWLFAPIALVFGLLVLFPIGRLTIKIQAVPAFKEIDASALPDVAWEYLEEGRHKFEKLGFQLGRYVASESVLPNQHTYAMTMTNRAEGMGVGFLYIKVAKAKDAVMDIQACEFTCIKDGVFVDLTNNTSTEPFLPMPGRKRLVLEDYPDEQLYYLARAVQQKMDCRCNDKMLELLETNPRLLMNDELRMMVYANIKRGYMYKDEKANTIRLTWKGAWLSAVQTLWPTSELYRHKLDKLNKAFFAQLDINPDDVAWKETEEEETSDLEQEVSSLSAAIELAIPVAKTHGFDMLPVSIGVGMYFDESGAKIDSIDVRYEQCIDHPDRKMYFRSSFLYQVNNTEKFCAVLENEEAMMSYDDFKEFEYEDKKPVTDETDKHLNIQSALERLYSEMGKTISSEQEDGYIIYQIEKNRPVWAAVDYQEDGMVSFSIDAQTGELVDKTIEKYD